MSEITRFAPSPTGFLHLGHAYSALSCEKAAYGGRFLLRIEDIDHTRCRPEYEAAIFEDLSWLGLSWSEPVWRQSERLKVYQQALENLRSRGLLYPCYCSRKDIQEALTPEAKRGADGPIYPGTCRNLSQSEQKLQEESGRTAAWRLDSAKAIGETGPLIWRDEERGSADVEVESFGDVILARRDIGCSYHLAVTLDDAAQGITLVTRGEDLLSATPIHRLLQALLELPQPRYRHHGLIRDEAGERLAKSKGSTPIRQLRQEGISANELRRELGF